MTNPEQPSRVALPMYTEVNRLKHVFRHFEGIPIPLPVAVTISGLVAGICWIVLSLKWIPSGDPLIKYVVIPIVLTTVISYFEPENVSMGGWIYAQLRHVFRPSRRVINGSVLPIGYWKEYHQYSIVRIGIKEEID